MTYASNLAGVANRMQDSAQQQGCRFLFDVGELLTYIAQMDEREESCPELLAVATSVAFAWLLDHGQDA